MSGCTHLINLNNNLKTKADLSVFTVDIITKCACLHDGDWHLGDDSHKWEVIRFNMTVQWHVNTDFVLFFY